MSSSHRSLISYKSLTDFIYKVHEGTWRCMWVWPTHSLPEIYESCSYMWLSLFMTHVFMNTAASHSSLSLSSTEPPPPSASLESEFWFWDLLYSAGRVDSVMCNICLRNFSGIIMTDREFTDLTRVLCVEKYGESQKHFVKIKLGRKWRNTAL